MQLLGGNYRVTLSRNVNVQKPGTIEPLVVSRSSRKRTVRSTAIRLE